MLSNSDRRIRKLVRIALAVFTSGMTQVCAASLVLIADEQDVHPGLQAVLSDSRHSVVRVDRRLNFDWTECAVDSRLGDGVRATWTGSLLVRSPADHVFHAMVSGKTTILVDDATVLQAAGDNVFHSGEPVALSAGGHRIQVTYERIEKSDAKLQLFWSSHEFTLEPLPADALSNDPTQTASLPEGTPHVDASLAESGRLLADALRCAACHDGLSELPALKAPSLQQINELSLEHLLARLTSRDAVSTDSMMPAFEFSKQDAESVAAFLRDAAGTKPVVDDNQIKFKPEDLDAGSKLLLTTGCVSCHAMSQLAKGFEPAASPYHGPDLSDVAQRRSVLWMMKWLQSPESLNPDHRMPVFSLSDDERRQIVAALLKSPPNEDSGVVDKSSGRGSSTNAEPASSEAIERGRKLVLAANCSGCHRIPGFDSPGSKFSRPSSVADFFAAGSCIAPSHVVRMARQGHRQPRYSVSDPQRNQLAAWLTSMISDLRPATNFSKGELLIRRSACLACHDRDQHRGISQLAGTIESQRDDLRGQSQTLIPPALTAVGDRLRDEVLMSAVAGEQTARRLPWLLVRMPKFAFSPDDRASIVRYFSGADRIPDAADSARPELFEHLNPHHPSLATSWDLLTGNQLTGASGFNCIACHKAGSYEPRNVAMGTRGSDIMTMGQRLRPRYFMRWMQNPIRAVPGIEMPTLRKPVAGVLDDSLSQQIAMMWKALADPKFSPPTVVSRYEQFVTVMPGDRPRVIRDVFTIGDAKARDSVARALAIGFGNGHNVLIDLDSMNLRQWTIGEFARQRTEGKSWFWDMAGVSVLLRSEASAFCRLRNVSSDSAEDLTPVIDERRQAELLSYNVSETSVTLRVRFHFEPLGKKGLRLAEDTEASPHSAITAWNDPARRLLQVVVQFTVQSANSGSDHSGWIMKAFVEECPGDYALVLDQWRPDDASGEIPWRAEVETLYKFDNVVQLSKGEAAVLSMVTGLVPPVLAPLVTPRLKSAADEITSLPGFRGRRLPIDTAIMPTAMTWLSDGQLAFTSLQGHVWIAKDTDGDQLVDSLSLFAEGLAAPYGIQADGESILVAHKPEILRLRDSDHDGKADQFDVVASGWGFSDDYHDWTTALVKDSNGDLFVGLGSDYSQNKRPADNDRWRGTVLKIDSTGAITPVAYSFRFPMGLALDRDHHLFATDNQGVQNTFNEINHVIAGKHYGVPSRHDTTKNVIAEMPALMVPHPWTRSVNSILFFPDDYSVPDLAGHGIGCEYDTRCLIRFTIQDVGGTLQGACYRFSLLDQPGGGTNFVGPVSSAIGPDGALYIGSIWDSGWQGGPNTGSIERLVPGPQMPNGIREIVATSNGFEVSFFDSVDGIKASDPENWSLQAYTRQWGGNYATPDSDRHALIPSAIAVSADGRTVTLDVSPLKAGYVYEISVRRALDDSNNFWPMEGHYSMKVVPEPMTE
jgi:mono/diheme cytochrome c family protein